MLRSLFVLALVVALISGCSGSGARNDAPPTQTASGPSSPPSSQSPPPAPANPAPAVGEALERVVVWRQIDANQRNIYMVNEDGTGEVVLGGSGRTNVSEAVTPTHRVIYINADSDASPFRYDVYAVNDDGSENRFLLSKAKYGTATRNDRVIATTPCLSFVFFDPPTQLACADARGDVLAIKTDGTGLIPLVSGSEAEGFEALYGR